MGKLREALRQWKHEWMCAVAPEKETAKYYRAVFGKDPDLVNPKTINEKIHYLKLGLYSDNETVTRCVDKVLVRDYLKERQLDDMLPLRLERKRFIEGSHGIERGERHAQIICQRLKSFSRNILKFMLKILHDGQAVPLLCRICMQDLLQFLSFDLHGKNSPFSPACNHREKKDSVLPFEPGIKPI